MRLAFFAATLTACGWVAETHKDYTFDLGRDAGQGVEDASGDTDQGVSVPEPCTGMVPTPPTKEVSSACWLCLQCQCNVTCSEKDSECVSFLACASQYSYEKAMAVCKGPTDVVECVQKRCDVCTGP